MILKKKVTSCFYSKFLSRTSPIFVLFFLFFTPNTHILANTFPIEKSVEIKLQQRTFTIDNATTETQLQEIERYFAKNHPDLLVRFANITTNSSGKVSSFDLQLKFKGDSKFNTRLIKTGHEKSDPVINLQYVKKGPALKIHQKGLRNVTLLVTKDDTRTIN